MATIVKVDNTVQKGAEVLRAVNLIAEGVALLRKNDGLRANAIGVSATEMASVFGVNSDANAQALSDRWGALLAALYDSGNANYDEFALLRDMIEATTNS